MAKSQLLRIILRFLAQVAIAYAATIAVGMVVGCIASLMDRRIFQSNRLLNVGDCAILNMFLPFWLVPSFAMFIVVWAIFTWLHRPLQWYGRMAFIIPLLVCEISWLGAWSFEGPEDGGYSLSRGYSITLPLGAVAWWWTWTAISKLRNQRDRESLGNGKKGAAGLPQNGKGAITDQ